MQPLRFKEDIKEIKVHYSVAQEQDEKRSENRCFLPRRMEQLQRRLDSQNDRHQWKMSAKSRI